MELRKGFILLTAVLIITANISKAADDTAYTYQRPRWDDICPEGLEDAEYKEIKFFWPDGTKSTQSIYNYWAERRMEFQNSLEQCDALNGGYQNTCYENLKKRQLFYNDQYKRDIHKQQVTKQIWRDIHDKGSSPIMIDIFQR